MISKESFFEYNNAEPFAFPADVDFYRDGEVARFSLSSALESAGWDVMPGGMERFLSSLAEKMGGCEAIEITTRGTHVYRMLRKSLNNELEDFQRNISEAELLWRTSRPLFDGLREQMLGPVGSLGSTLMNGLPSIFKKQVEMSKWSGRTNFDIEINVDSEEEIDEMRFMELASRFFEYLGLNMSSGELITRSGEEIELHIDFVRDGGPGVISLRLDDAWPLNTVITTNKGDERTVSSTRQSAARLVSRYAPSFLGDWAVSESVVPGSGNRVGSIFTHTHSLSGLLSGNLVGPEIDTPGENNIDEYLSTYRPSFLFGDWSESEPAVMEAEQFRTLMMEQDTFPDEIGELSSSQRMLQIARALRFNCCNPLLGSDGAELPISEEELAKVDGWFEECDLDDMGERELSILVESADNVLVAFLTNPDVLVEMMGYMPNFGKLFPYFNWEESQIAHEKTVMGYFTYGDSYKTLPLLSTNSYSDRNVDSFIDWMEDFGVLSKELRKKIDELCLDFGSLNFSTGRTDKISVYGNNEIYADDIRYGLTFLYMFFPGEIEKLF